MDAPAYEAGRSREFTGEMQMDMATSRTLDILAMCAAFAFVGAIVLGAL